MKKILNFLVLGSAFAVIVAGCKGKGPANDPKAVVVAFFEKMAKKDLDGAAKLATKDSKAALDMMKKGMDMAEKMKTEKPEEDPMAGFKDVEFGDAKITGDAAVVPITNKKEKETIEFPLKKEDGSWKVDFSMSTLMKMGMDKAKETGGDTFDNGGTENTNGLDALSPDSLTKGLEEAKKALENIKPEDIEKMKEAVKGLENMNK